MYIYIYLMLLASNHRKAIQEEHNLSLRLTEEVIDSRGDKYSKAVKHIYIYI